MTAFFTLLTILLRTGLTLAAGVLPLDIDLNFPPVEEAPPGVEIVPVVPGDDQNVPPAQDAPPAQDDLITYFLEGDTLDPAQKLEFRNIMNSLKTKCRTNLQNERVIIKRYWIGGGSSYESRATNHYLKNQVGQLRARGLEGDFVLRECRRWAKNFKSQKRRSHFYQGLLRVLRYVDLH